MIKKYYLFYLLICCAVTFGYGQVTIAVQDFENIPATPTLNYSFNTGAFNSVSGNSGGGDRPQNSPQFTSSNKSWRVRDTNVDVDFGPTNITAYESVQVEFNLAGFSIGSTGNGLDGGDYVDVYISLDNGVTWSYELEITGNSNARWAFNSGTNRTITYDGDDNPTSYSSTNANPIDNIIINIPDTDAAIASNFLVGFIVNNNSSNESWNIDDVIIEGTPSATNSIVEFVSTSSILAEDGLFIDVCVEIINPSTTNATTVDIILDGSSTAVNGSDYDDGAGIPAAIIFPQTLTFPANSSANQCLTVFISNDDLLIEGDENIVLNLTNPTGGDSAVLGTDTQHILTITDNDIPAISDVVITEIMYNTSGTDDEWIEICNVSGSAQVLNNYTIEVDGTTEFTFPSSGVVLADGDCFTIALGDGGGADFNPDCPFTPDYTNGSGTGTLNNTSDPISLIASDGTTTIDNVTYNSSDGGNTTSLHVIDTSIDNSATSSNYWEVINGGSPGVNSLISPCTPIGPEINLEGTTANFPDISNPDTTPAAFDGTDFGGVTIGGTSTNTFRIENFGGTQDLTITSVTVFSGDVGDFSISSSPSSPIAALDYSLFDIEFSPTAIGARTVIIEIISDDSDNNPYIFTVTGNGLCAASAITALPTSGPAGTVVTVTGTNLSTATASFNGVVTTVNNISSTEMEVTVPSGASSGNLEIVDDLGCPGTTPFTIIESEISSCEGSSGTTPTDLFISEVTDASTGGLTYIEIYNGTGSTINLGSYSIQFFNNGNATQNGGVITLNSVNLASGNIYVLSVSAGSSECTGITGADGSLSDQTGSAGINFVTNGDDHIRLYDGTTHVDSWGEYLSDTWADPLGIGSEGVVFTRNNNSASLPNTIFNIADWAYTDWTACADNDYSNIGLYDFSIGTPPVVNSITTSTTACNEITLTISASEGFIGGNAIEYHWYLYDPSQSGLGWQSVTNGGIYTTTTNSPNLVISDVSSVSDYQFYCEVRENDATCYTASNAIGVTLSAATWDGTNWTWNDGTAIDTLPTLSCNVILASNFSTADSGLQQSFNACNLTINDNITLIINDGHFVQVENDLIVNNTTTGGINIEPQGSFVQINDSGLVTAATPSNLNVIKETAGANNAYEYTYWGSPVINETVGGALSNSDPNKRFWFNAQNYLDSTFESGNDNTTGNTPGLDDIDDAAPWDWQAITNTSTTLAFGTGYATAHDPAVFGATPGCPGPLCNIRYTFSGLFNNGNANTVTIYRNDSETGDNNWNLIGNPYPSAIEINGPNGFLTQNTAIIDGNVTGGAIDGAIFIWSQNTVPTDTDNGNENINFSQSDYAIVNGLGAVSAGGDTTPNGFIPSGQGFFISMSDTSPAYDGNPTIKSADIIFNNAMRSTGNNNLFFRNDPVANQNNKIWLNLESDNGVFNEILIGYTENASNEYDGMYYDAPRNGSTDVNSNIYTTIGNNEKQFAIQGKNINSLTLDEVIPLGFYTSINEATIYTLSIAQLEGEFMTSNPIYVIDNLSNTIHELSTSDYTFTSETGKFDNRFEIVFTPDALSIKDNLIDASDLTIIELTDGDVKVKVNSDLTIVNVDIIDVTGRLIYKLEGNSSTEIYNLSQLSKAAYIAKVTLSNGQIISKKAMKQH
ncbi:lamin tail domain-containing protein [Winogradskyella sp. PG-2]|uniref:lamin tail domain-containing protein n=1 Tax=Winogradskyella sp. PG-2 TaxID=754409 RepID=UPI00045890E5|nr:lamin tail domain-containing protein [Winogradskyella sp. PG-2]BAO75774.1 hypothetical protein WPG_1544 [Winogradskyella sp. PG-2]